MAKENDLRKCNNLTYPYLAYIFFLHNLCVLSSNLSDNFLYLVTFTFKLAKHKITAKM